MSLPICGRQSTTRPFRFGFGCYFSTLKYFGPHHFSKLKRFRYKKIDGGKKPAPNRAEERGGAEKAQGPVHTPRPIHPQPASPHSEDMRAFRVPHPRPIHAKHSNQHTAKLTAYHCPTSPLTQGPSHSQIDGRRQAAHPTREESVMAGSMQVPSMAMCGIDGFERPPTPLPIGACISFGFEYSNPKQVHVLFEGVKGGRTKPHQLHSLGKTLPRAGHTGKVQTRAATAQTGKTLPM